MKIIGVIPARYQSSRFPGKPLAKIMGKPMIIHVLERTIEALGQDNTYVATDSEEILSIVLNCGFKAVLTSSECPTGTDRLWDFARQVTGDIYINVQGDEPLIAPEDIKKAVQLKLEFPYHVINGMAQLDPEKKDDITIPKVLVNNKDELIYMSRLAIPGIKSKKDGVPTYFKQVCIYGFSYNQLKAFGSRNEKATYEKYEDIEILRFFDLGFKIKMFEASGDTIAVDLPKHIAEVENYLMNSKK